jgi:glycosyltransferase involved in cell wall biosynthesis
MNLVGLMPVRNEAWVLRAAAEVALGWLDAIVILNHASTDESEEIIDSLYREYPGRVWSIKIVDPAWDEMQHRQTMLECARRVGATHIAIVDADEIMTADIVGRVRNWVESLQTGEVLQLPLYNLRGSLDHYHDSGLWGKRYVSLAFKDDPRLNWSGDQLHHREPMGLGLRAIPCPVAQGAGGIMHLWGADLRRLRAKHALYKMTERVRWPEKSIEGINDLYDQWKGPKGHDPVWTIARVPREWWEGLPKTAVRLNEVPWQEEKCRSLQANYGSFMFKGLDLFGCTDTMFVDTAPRFSLCHATARLDKWRDTALQWFQACDRPEDVEYILAVDEGTEVAPLIDQLPEFGSARIVVNTNRRCSVDAWNEAARASTGKFLINLADDLRAPEHWDTELLRAVPNVNQAYVLDVNTGGAAETLLPFSFLTRKYLERLTDQYGYEGGFFYPAYRGMYCDTEFTDLVRKDGVLINARHLYFEHVHPFFGKGEMDGVYQRQNAPEEYAFGRTIYDQRLQALGISGIVKQSTKFVMTFCMPGESFSHLFMARWTELYSHLSIDWNVLPIFAYCTNVYINRMTIWEAIRMHPIQPHLVVWVDDDNLITMSQLNQLIQDLNDHPEADIMAGWCWINRGMSRANWGASCGLFDEDGIGHALTADEMTEGADVKEVDFTGFPVVLMRGSLLEKCAANNAFRPWLSEKHPWGFAGEDVSFCHWAKAAGARIFVDRRVRVQHLKLMDHGPAAVQELTRPAGKTSEEGVSV